MKAYIEQLKGRLENQLSIYQEEKQPLRRLKLCKEATREAIVELALLTPTKGLSDPEEILLYHTQWAPYFYAKLHYFNKCFDLELNCLTMDENERKRLYEHELKGIQYFLQRHSGFYQTYSSGDYDKDPAFYWSNAFSDPSALEEPALFSALEGNDGRKLVALIVANEQYRDYLKDKLLGSDKGSAVEDKNVVALPKAKWVRTKTDLAEFWMSIFVDKAIEIDGKPVTIGYYEKLSQLLFGISFSNISVTYRKMRDRKKGITPCLDRLKKGLIDRADQLDDDRSN